MPDRQRPDVQISQASKWRGEKERGEIRGLKRAALSRVERYRGGAADSKQNTPSGVYERALLTVIHIPARVIVAKDRIQGKQNGCGQFFVSLSQNFCSVRR